MIANLKVGITVFLRQGPQSLWESGIFQNCFFIAMLLKKTSIVKSVFFVNGGDGKFDETKSFLDLVPVDTIDMERALFELDVIIELGAQLNRDWAIKFRERNGRVIAMHVANDYAIDIERMIFDKPSGFLVTGVRYDMVWTLPAFEKTCKEYYETTLKAPVKEMPHLWSPVLLDRAAKMSDPSASFGYKPGRRRWRLGILEPNVCSVKTSHMAMLLVDLAYRKNPGFVEHLRTFNTFHLIENQVFLTFSRSLNIVRHGKATFEARFPIYELMSKEVDVVIAHHWHNAQNYLYYEALYGGYPLIHNSTMLGGCGYYYSDFNCEEGALALQLAFSEHDQKLSDYCDTASHFIASLNPESQENIEIYSQELTSVFERI